jgi:hypothetical protein
MLYPPLPRHLRSPALHHSSPDHPLPPHNPLPSLPPSPSKFQVSNTLALRVQRTIPVINRAAASVGLKFDHASALDANSNANEFGVRHRGARLNGDARPVLHLTTIRLTSKVSLALEPEAAVPAVATDLERAPIAQEAWGVVAGVCIGVDGLSVVADNCEAVVAAAFAAAAWATDGAEVTARPHDSQVLGLCERERGREGEGDALEGGHIVGVKTEVVVGVWVDDASVFWLLRNGVG